MDRKGLADLIERGATDDTAHAARVRACRAVTDGLAAIARALAVGGWMLRDPGAETLGVVSEMGAQLARGAILALDEGLWYPAAALVRQLVEVEYLAFTFSTDARVAATWLTTSAADARRLFAPAAMRKASGGRFREEEYRTHCEMGGHPNPRGRALLGPQGGGALSPRLGWVDLGQHLERLWALLITAVREAAFEQALPNAVRAETDAAVAFWHTADPLADRLPAGLLK